MGYTDKNLTCSDCNKEFAFTANEQEFYATKGYTNEPKRCPECREARKSSRGGSGARQGFVRQMFTTVCAQCGKQAEIPFEPRSDRPVYCSDCYNTIKPRR